MVGIRYLRNYSSDHFALQTRLLQRLAQCRSRYFQGRRAFPLSLPAPEDFRIADKKIQ